MEMMPEVTDNPEVMFWYAVTLASVGKVDDSLAFFKKVFTANPIWRDLVPRLVKAELLQDFEQVLALSNGADLHGMEHKRQEGGC